MGAKPVKIEAVVGGGEAGSVCNLVQALVHQMLDIAVEMNVFNAAAADADEVVVVTEQRFGQFEVGVITPRIDPPDDPAAKQHV